MQEQDYYKDPYETEKKTLTRFYLIASVIVTLVIVLFVCTILSRASEIEINMDKIAFIESSNNPNAINKKDDSIGLYQITPILLREWNNFHPKEQYVRADLFDPDINYLIAHWYLHKRIPAMLKHFKINDSIENRLISFNCGISCLTKNRELPKITKDYLTKYRR
jgi:hypothetical protein